MLWSQTEKTILKKHYLVVNKKQIQQLLPNRTWRAIYAQALNLHLWLKGKKGPNWTTLELAILKKYRAKLTAEELQKYLPNRSLNGIRGKGEEIGLKSRYYWTKDEIKALKTYYPTRNKRKLKELIPNRNWMSITQKARKLGIQGLGTSVIQRERMKLLNKDREFNQKRLKALCRKPTLPERRLIEIIEENKLPYKYVGNGSFMIESLNPDFINIDGKKHIIEVFGRIWHDTLLRDKDWKRSELGRVMVYNSYGFKTLIIWDDEMDNKKVIANKIKLFDKGSRVRGGVK